MATALPLATSLDVVGVYNSAFQQVFLKARPVSAAIRPIARIMDHPLETGSIISDYKVILPLEIQYNVILPSPYTRDLYEEIWDLWQSSELLTVQTKAKNYANMIIAEPPHEEKTDYFDALPMTIKFRQAQLVPSVTQYAPVDPTQVNTQNLGQQNSYAVTPTATTAPITIPNGTVLPVGTDFLSSVPPQQPAYTITGVQSLGGTTSIPSGTSLLSPSTPEITGIASAPAPGVQSTIYDPTIGSGFY